jgi:hypothetical protein
VKVTVPAVFARRTDDVRVTLGARREHLQAIAARLRHAFGTVTVTTSLRAPTTRPALRQ